MSGRIYKQRKGKALTRGGNRYKRWLIARELDHYSLHLPWVYDHFIK